VFVEDVIYFTIFSRNSSRKKRFFKFTIQLSHVHHQIFAIIYCLPRLFGSFIPKPGDLDSRLGGYKTRVISDLFFKFARG
jgi:hypothetical protein